MMILAAPATAKLLTIERPITRRVSGNKNGLIASGKRWFRRGDCLVCGFMKFLGERSIKRRLRHDNFYSHENLNGVFEVL